MNSLFPFDFWCLWRYNAFPLLSFRRSFALSIYSALKNALHYPLMSGNFYKVEELRLLRSPPFFCSTVKFLWPSIPCPNFRILRNNRHHHPNLQVSKLLFSFLNKNWVNVKIFLLLSVCRIKILSIHDLSFLAIPEMSFFPLSN